MSETHQQTSSKSPPAGLSLADLQDQFYRNAFTNQQYQQRTDNRLQQLFGSIERLERMVAGLSLNFRPQQTPQGMFQPPSILPQTIPTTFPAAHILPQTMPTTSAAEQTLPRPIATTSIAAPDHHADFLQKVELRFGTSRYEDYQGKLSKLIQITTVTEYQSEFECLMNKVIGISESVLTLMFIAGLKSHIRREVQRARPPSLMEAFALAREHESQYEELQADLARDKRSSFKWQNRNLMSTIPSPQTATPIMLPPTPSTALAQTAAITKTTPNPLPIRRLSPQEMREKRAKGLCYNCDQKYTANHRCRSRVLMLLGTDDDDLVTTIGDNEGLINDHANETVILGDISSLNTMAGPGTPRSLRLLGEIKKSQVQVLIDGESTHNFIQPTMAEELNLETHQIPTFRVYIGNGNSLECNYCCKDVCLKLQGTDFTIDLYVLPIQGSDVVLRVQWLQGLGKVAHDYASLTMEFTWKGRTITLSGIQTLSPQKISFNQLQAMLRNDGVCRMFELIHRSDDSRSVTEKSENVKFPDQLPQGIMTILHKYEHVFHTPSGLPPHRLLNHQITLAPGSKPVNVKPYRYPHFQKGEIERHEEENREHTIHMETEGNHPAQENQVGEGNRSGRPTRNRRPPQWLKDYVA
nr:Transposon Ty3-G Gag-Pol polyprotein [Ipomoea batatas]